MKQLANQTVARAEKTEVLCEDLLQFKLCMDMVQSIYHHSHKSLMHDGVLFFVEEKIVDFLHGINRKMVEAGNQVEYCKDQFAADTSSCMAKEGQYNKFFVSLLEAQADYHQKALAVLGRALTGIIEVVLVETCVIASPREPHREGHFKIGIGASKLKKLRAVLDCSTSRLDEFYSDPHPSLLIPAALTKCTAIIFVPNLLWAKNEGMLAEMAVATSIHVVMVIEQIIQYDNWFFPIKVKYHITLASVGPEHPPKALWLKAVKGIRPPLLYGNSGTGAEELDTPKTRKTTFWLSWGPELPKNILASNQSLTKSSLHSTYRSGSRLALRCLPALWALGGTSIACPLQPHKHPLTQPQPRPAKLGSHSPSKPMALPMGDGNLTNTAVTAFKIVMDI
ncbi:hypothetical protein E2I00_001015 [Balaenoptera physalus]|uniref:Uncharacterized protein n=1 Tax=Balaenoptera physalus TaxID=9770 RepID=A0A643BPL4_BALPH|nr:hypothetical protein E2I00_001015 [Balaenoptera physalus]